MAILTVRLTDEEDRLLERRSRKARMKRATYLRMPRRSPFGKSAAHAVWARTTLGSVRSPTGWTPSSLVTILPRSSASALDTKIIGESRSEPD